MACFTDCRCMCGVRDGTFDRVMAEETKWDLTLSNLLDAHAGWYHDAALDDGSYNELAGWPARQGTSVYILWRQHDYCSEHGYEHLRAMYVGKGEARQRLNRHRLTKVLGNGLAVHISLWTGPNRQAKYVEQLLLDTFAFPFNIAENEGSTPLCHHIAPAEWN